MNIDQLYIDLRRDESERTKPYKDSVGKLSIGVGRNLDDVGLRHDEIQLMLQNDVATVVYDLDTRYPWWRNMTAARQNALANMCFNLGIVRLSGFKNMMALLALGKYDQAATEALNSKWATQVGDRAKRIAELFRKGSY